MTDLYITAFLDIVYVFSSPTAIALGSSGIVKVSGQNCFRTLYGSPGQIRLGLLRGSAEGSTKVPPKVAPRFHQGCASFVVSLVFWGRSVLGCQKVLWLWKVPPRLRKFRGVSDLLGQIRLGLPKGSVEGPPRSHRGSTKVWPRLRKLRYLSGLLGQIVLGC